MEIKIIHDREMVCNFLKEKTRFNYIYQFNNIDKNNWRNVICYGLFENKELREIAMININYGIPVLLAANFSDSKYSVELIKNIKNFLPKEFYTHIDKITIDKVFNDCEISEYEEYINMGIDNNVSVKEITASDVIRLGSNNLDDIKELISNSYPEAWLDDDLIKLNENFGIYNREKLISFAGIHAYSEEMKVAAVAHVTTHPDYRNRGYAENVVNALVRSLKNKISFIGLNVKSDNISAINCYKKLGFKEYGKFAACTIKRT
ncbi:GNAT family N-acetyltransferase [Clostridium intestinale]|uniref:Acyltransferase n=1 Tax=Clostridium intestinale URNW TaxID=1294142 RepID=U2NQM5_9CLOT|nr:GNAT family N-acetyltransferase [Clostridium intestinale]ERK31156.1 acyltransferase [Clostridium intestinale URNW]